MGLLNSSWDDLSFASKGYITCGTTSCTNWQTASLHHVESTIHVLADISIDVTLPQEPDADHLDPFTVVDMDVEPFCVHNTIYLPAPFVRIFLECYLTPMEVWTRLYGTILNGG